MTRQTRCVDCNAAGVKTPRAALKPGPRCEEHWRERKRVVSKAAHTSRIERDYNVSGEQYDAVYESQGGRCFVCQKATGKRKRLAIDHDHDCDQGHDPKMACPLCFRALLCGRCNRLIGFLDADALRRAAQVLEDPPAQKVLQSLGKETRHHERKS